MRGADKEIIVNNDANGQDIPRGFTEIVILP
jgi:hypothetical protein